ncbi:MAG: hypothetical protein NTV44_00355, partial [Firmicutes bacterium]|nr:hypothetical protein [Bacillota bacterium]
MKWIRLNGYLLLTCLLEMLLMAVGIFFEPSINFMSMIGIFLVPILTFVLLYVFKKDVHEKAIFLFSLLLVVLYFVEISLEYLIQPASTEVFGIVEYGLVAVLCVIAAIYFHEYAREGWLLSFLRSCVSTLAGVPSIVFGLFGLAFFL